MTAKKAIADKKFKKIKKIATSKSALVVFICFLFVLGLYWIFLLTREEVPKQVYTVAVVARQSGDLDYGDVLLYKEGGDRSWSKTEELSYLLLKMNLSKEEAQKLTESEDRQLSKEEKSQELARFKESMGENLSQDELKNFNDELDNRTIQVKARKYGVDMDEFKDFSPNRLLKGQPYLDEIYTWKIIEEKK